MAGLFSPTIETGGGQPVQATNVQSPSTATQLAPAVAQGASQLLDFFGRKNVAEAKVSAVQQTDKAKSEYAKEMLYLSNIARTGKGVNTSMLRSKADRLTMQYMEKYPSLVDDFTKIRKDYSSIAGLGKALAEGTPEEQQAASNAKSASDAGFVLPSFTEEEKQKGVNDYLRIKRSVAELDYVGKQQGVDAATKKVESQKALVGFFRSTTADFSRKAKTVAEKFEKGELDAAQAKAELDLLYETTSVTAGQIGAYAGSEFISGQSAGVKTLYDNATAMIKGDFSLQALQNKNKSTLALQESLILEDPEMAPLVAFSNLVDNQNVGFLQKLNVKATQYLLSMDKTTPNNPDPFTDKESAKVGYEALMNKVKTFNSNPAELSEAELGALDTSVNSLLNGVYENQLKITSPKDLKDFVTFFANPQMGKQVEKSGGMLPDASRKAKEVIKMEYTDKVMPKLRTRLEQAVVTQIDTSLSPLTSSYINRSSTAKSTKKVPLMDYVDIDTSNGTISFQMKQGLENLDSVAKSEVINSLRGLNKEVSPLMNEMVRLGAHLEGSTNYKQFLNDNVDSVFGLRSQEEPAKPAPKVNDSIDPIAQLNKQAQEQNVDLTSYEDGDYTDGNQVFTIKGGKVVGVK